MAWSNPSTFTAGQTAGVSTNLNLMVGNDLVFGSAWSTWTPTVSGFTSVVTTPTGRYIQAGKLCIAQARIVIGTVTTLGSSTITFALPATVTASQLSSQFPIGTAVYVANGGNVFTGYVWASASGTTAAVRVPAGTTTSNVVQWTGAAPTGQVAGDEWRFNLCYETT